MRYQRLTLEAGSAAFTLALHPRLTVIAGVGRQERDGLVGELLGALAGTRRSCSLDLMDDHGRRLVLTRTDDAEHDRVVERDGERDVTHEFTVAERVDVLGSLGLGLSDVRRRCRLSSADIAAASRSDALLSRLARCDQPTLWRSAERLQATDGFLRTEAVSIGGSGEDAAVIEIVEERHARFESAQAQLEKVRHFGIFTGAACALGGIPAVMMNHLAALGFAVVASLTLALGVLFRRRKTTAERKEREALAGAGAETYIGFHIQRMSVLLEQQANRKRLADAAAAHRAAQDEWGALAGEAGVDWALANRERILAAHRRLDASSPADIDLVALGLQVVEPAEMAQALVARLADLRHAGRGGEAVPLVLDDPLVGLDASVVQWMLELIGRSAGSPQCIYFTEDADVAAWARMEAIAGHLALIEPNPEARTPDGIPRELRSAH